MGAWDDDYTHEDIYPEEAVPGPWTEGMTWFDGLTTWVYDGVTWNRERKV